MRIFKRLGLLQRKSAGQAVSRQLIAANVDWLFIVSSCNEEFRLRPLLLLLICTPAVLMVSRILAQETVMLWYGRGLVDAAHASAELVAKGEPWCVIDFDGADAFETMNKRKILIAAVQKSRGFRG